MRSRSRERFLIARGLWLIVAILLPGGVVSAQAVADGCTACHRALAEPRLSHPVSQFSDDIHRSKGFGCGACHGGDAQATGKKEAKDRGKGYVGVPAPEQIPQICARCHADPAFMRQYNPALRVDQLTEYRTSVHGRRLMEKRDRTVATCASCHTSHEIRTVSDPRATVHPSRVVDTCGRCHGDATYMAGHQIPTDQVMTYKRSVHWVTLTTKGDLSAPTCNDCHGNHGATPPGVASVGHVCARCHNVQGEFFERSKHRDAFEAMGTPGCATCHSNHEIIPARDGMLGLNEAEGGLCSTCHSAEDAGGKAAVEMRAWIDRLRSAHEASEAVLARAERSGMEVSQAQFDLNGAVDALVKARAAVHAFTPEAVRTEAAPGLEIAQRAHARGDRALAELAFRRRGLFASLVVIGLVIAGLLLKIRELEGRHG